MTDQPMPTTGPASRSVTDALVSHLLNRQAKGIATYGQSLHSFNGRDPVQDALEEALDLSQYLMQVKMERDALCAEIGRLQTWLIAIRDHDQPEVVKDDFAYDRLQGAYRKAAAQALAEAPILDQNRPTA